MDGAIGNEGIVMSASSKTAIDLLLRPTKRLKSGGGSSSSSPPLAKVVSTTCKSSSSPPPDNSSDTITAQQKSRIEFNKLRAQSRRNQKICLDRVSNSKSEGGGIGCLKLEQLLVDTTWLEEALPGELQKPYAKELCKFVQTEIAAADSGAAVPIYPPPHLIFNALNTTPFDRVRVVIIGQDPYHGPGQAMGLSFSVPEGVKLPSSLINIYKELQHDLCCAIPTHGNLERWAVQGVLLLNAVLTDTEFVDTEFVGGYLLRILGFRYTVRHHQANSHAKKGWEQFTDAVIKAISDKKKGVVFLLWGNYAQAKSRLIDERKHHILKAAHPSGLSAHRGFFGCRHFSRTNELLLLLGATPPIDWQL